MVFKFGNSVKCAFIRYAHRVFKVGAQWLSGRVLDSRPKGGGFEPHRRHCVVVLEQDTFILANWFNQGRLSRITEILLSGRKESNQTKRVFKATFGERKNVSYMMKYSTFFRFTDERD